MAERKETLTTPRNNKNKGIDKKIAILTDTHFGVRKGSQIFHDYFQNFYDGTFFPALDSGSIDTVVHVGDCFDVRKGIDYWSLDWAKTHFFDPLKERGIQLHLLVGNHDTFYRNSLEINSPRLNLREYDNVHVYDRPQTISVKGTQFFMAPWICEDNAEEFTEQLDATTATICFGHLELAGFYANKDYKCDHGTDPKIFDKFDSVFSGHFHKKSKKGNITYLGNTYQMYWNDEGETRGFHTLDLETNKLKFIANPNNMFHKIYYKKDTILDYTQYKNTYIKLIIEDQVTPLEISNMVDRFYEQSCHDVKVIESVNIDIDDDVEVEAEDTLTTLTNYVNSMDDSVSKQNLIGIFKSLYVEAQEV